MDAASGMLALTAVFAQLSAYWHLRGKRLRRAGWTPHSCVAVGLVCSFRSRHALAACQMATQSGFTALLQHLPVALLEHAGSM